MIIQDQQAVLEFLTDPNNHGDPALVIHTQQTHISIIIFAGTRVFKLKRAVRLPYVDFSTPGRRFEACHQELMLNRRTAPSLYLAVRSITREDNGSLKFDGQGDLVDAVVEMVRFDEDTLFDRLAVQGQLTPDTITQLAHTIANFHTHAVVNSHGSGAARIAKVLEINERSLINSGILSSETISSLSTGLWRTFDQHVTLLNARGQAGKIRRCHGDLHLRNICLVNGTPTLFDCIEFDETLATIDVLYDLAFLLMDLWYRGLESNANLVFNRYLDECDEIDGLALLPFFMSMRATIRAHITAEQASQDTGQKHAELLGEANSYATLALRLLEPIPAQLVAIGGLSGTGKSTVAAAIAHVIGPAPGARILASDRIRKQRYGVAPQTRLPEQAYQPEISEQVYMSLASSAQAILSKGHSALADAVFNQPDERQRIEHIAKQAGVSFTGVWLYARPEQLISRVEQRLGDPSDATAQVVRKQLTKGCGQPDWFQVDANEAIATTLKQVSRVITGPSL